MKKDLLLLILPCILLYAVSCSGNEESEEEIPAYVLEHDKYVKLLCDMAMAEGAANVNVKGVMAHQYDSVYAFNPLKENGVSKVQYDSTLAYYSRHPQLFKDLYEDVLNELSKIQTAKTAVSRDSLHVPVR